MGRADRHLQQAAEKAMYATVGHKKSISPHRAKLARPVRRVSSALCSAVNAGHDILARRDVAQQQG
jgi:hypothetical protein